VLSSIVLYQHVVFFDPGKSVVCLHPVPSPTALTFDRLRTSRHFPHPSPPILAGEIQFRGFTTVHFRYNLLICSPPLSELTGCFPPANRDFYIRAFNGLIARPVAGYDYSGNWAISTGGIFTHKNID
jgi:hypothetical protein